MPRSEADTRIELIDPKLRIAGWDEPRIEREYLYRKGRVRLLGDQPVRDAPQYVDYILRHRPNGLPLGIVEAKDESHGAGAGLQQAIAYARDLGVRFAFSSNGQGIVEQDLCTGAVAKPKDFPGPDELFSRYQAGDSMRGPQVTNRRGEMVGNPLIEPVRVGAGGRRLRYYQEAAVTAAIEEILAGKSRALLALATGTGKTFIANNVVWKLMKSGYFKKTLFLVDRLSLWKQAYNDFSPFGDARGLVTSAEIPIRRDVHFATYQTLYMPLAGGRLFQQYPADYFDLIVVDECHRSGYGDWGAILNYFSDAFHLGMTATPKRTDSIDTYEFFGGQNRDEDDEPQPAYEYSLGRGIEDGYLATYQVHRVTTNIDASGLRVEDELAKGAELFVPEAAELRDVYEQAQFEREIVIPDRTRLLCRDLAGKLRSWGVNEKTMVFCATVEHAEQVRSELQTLLGPETGKNLYAARIVSEERDAQELLESFQRSDSAEPIVATTVDLLTTGVDVPAVRNIVFMKPIGSPTVFKQIVGRGSRIDEATGKEYFRVVDYTNATRLFDSWDAPQDGYDGPIEGDGMLTGTVADAETDEPIENAAVSIIVGRNERVALRTEGDGTFEAGGLPEVPVTILVGAAGYGRVRLRHVPQPATTEPLTIKLREINEKGQRVEISGVEVTISDETVLTLEDDGTQLTVKEYFDFAGEQVRTFAGDTITLAELWRDPKKRHELRQQLKTQNVDPAVLALVLERSDADEFDLLAHAAFGDRIRSREERARHLEQLDQAFLHQFDERQRAVVDDLLDKYRLGGVEEISSSSVFQVPPFLDDYGGVAGLSALFGGPNAVAELLLSIQAHLYAQEEAA